MPSMLHLSMMHGLRVLQLSRSLSEIVPAFSAPPSPPRPPLAPPVPQPPPSPPPPSIPYFDWSVLDGTNDTGPPPLVWLRPLFIALLALSILTLALLLGCCCCWESCVARKRSRGASSPAREQRMTAEDPFPAPPGEHEMHAWPGPHAVDASPAGSRGGASVGSAAEPREARRGSSASAHSAPPRPSASPRRPTSRGSSASAGRGSSAPERQIERHLETAELDLEAVEAVVNGYATSAQHDRIDAQWEEDEPPQPELQMHKARPVYEVEPPEQPLMLSFSSEPVVCAWLVLCTISACMLIASATLLGLSFL